MASATVNERLSLLEARLNQLQQLLDEHLPSVSSSDNKAKRGWQTIVGTFANDPLYEEAMRRGQEWRQSQHEDSSKASV
ncbi:hypothetical protein [Armatimonas sp.]|uniref:hypothetical protein n=1 Tax=Armatimonas sp. TaxID=1872638 RepID=UPI003751DAFB